MKTNVISFPTSKSGDYCKDYEKAAFVLISSLIRKGRKNICLEELYDILSANTKAEKNGIQWVVCASKEKDLIASTEIRGFYKVI